MAVIERVWLYIYDLINKKIPVDHERLQLIKTRSDINRKAKSLQTDLTKFKLKLEKYYKPLTQPLNKHHAIKDGDKI